MPVVPCFALPIGNGRYRMIYEHPIEPPRPDSEDPVREFTQRCTDVLEMYVRRQPELWLWMLRRWRDESAVGGMFPRGPESDGTLESQAGPHVFVDYFVDGDTTALDPICSVLAG